MLSRSRLVLLKSILRGAMSGFAETNDQKFLYYLKVFFSGGDLSGKTFDEAKKQLDAARTQVGRSKSISLIMI